MPDVRQLLLLQVYRQAKGAAGADGAGVVLREVRPTVHGGDDCQGGG